MEFERRIGLCFIISAFLIFAMPAMTNAATLYFNPSSDNFTVGDIFSVSVLVNTQGAVINSAEFALNFPTDFLEVVSINKSASIFSLWVEEPSFSNNAGTISLTGGLPTPGFNGSAGNIIKTVFRAKRAGLASLVFSSAAVRANDGEGTNILTSSGTARFNLIYAGQLAPESTTLVETAGVPTAPQISSPTHPDSNKWYALKNAKFTWILPKDANATRLLVGKIPQAIPTVTYSPVISLKEIDSLKDGIWYFSVRLRNDVGWGSISHFRFQIDTGKPDYFNIKEVERKDLTDPVAKFIFDASDSVSGIDHYEVQIDSAGANLWQDEGNHIYKTPITEPGKHILIAKAVDKAGNFLAGSTEFQIDALQPPKITDYPKQLQSNEILIAKGETLYPDAKIVLWLQGEKEDAKNYAVKSEQDGKFTFIANERLKEGIYKMWAEVVDKRGARSGPSEKVNFIVQQTVLFRIGSWAVSFLAIIIPLLALLILLLFLLWYAWRKFSKFKKKVEKEVHEVEHLLHRAFDLLREDIREQIRMLEKVKTKRQLTREEDGVIKKLKKDLDDAEKFIRKEIKDIESL